MMVKPSWQNMISKTIYKTFMSICSKIYLATKHSASRSTMTEQEYMHAFHMADKTIS